MRNRRQRCQVGHVQLRVADRLGVDRLHLGRDGLLERAQIVGRNEVHLDAEARERVVEEVVGPAVQVVEGDDLVSGPGDVEEREHDGGLPAGDGQRAAPPSSCARRCSKTSVVGFMSRV
jgi:hypothetical protein